MTITWHGKTCVVVDAEGGKAIFNPPAKSTGLKVPRGPFDLVLFSDPVPPKSDWQGLVGKETVVIDGPGEWDHKGFFVLALPSGNEKKEPNIFLVEQERKVIAHIAHYSKDSISEQDLGQIESVDVLAISVGGNDKEGDNPEDPINAEKAMKIANQLEPKIILLIDFEAKGHKEKREDAKSFLKEAGASNKEAQNKLNIKKNSALSEEDTEIVVLKP